MASFKELNAKELYELGEKLGSLAKERPDITHQVLLGLRDGMTKTKTLETYGLGEIFWSLWRVVSSYFKKF